MIPVTLWTWAGLAMHQETVWEGTLPAVPAPGDTITVRAPDPTGESYTYRVVTEATGAFAPVEWQVTDDGTLVVVRVQVG